MHFSTNKTTLLFIVIHLISITLIHISSASDPKCSPSDNLKWNKNKKKCVQCPKCHPGFFRNLTESYTGRVGTHGAERCIRCRPCPVGTYSRSGYGECAKCVVNCTELDREFAEPCTKLHDAKCGSCLNGFYDMFKNTKFPCAPKIQKSMRLLDPPQKPSNKPKKFPDENLKTPVGGDSDVKSTSKGDTTNRIEDTIDVQPSKSPVKDVLKLKSDFGIGLIVVIVAGCTLMILPLVGFAVFRVYNRTRRNERRISTKPFHTVTQGTYAMVNDLSCDNDIEMDTFAQMDETGTTRYHPIPHTEGTAVRSELEPSVQLYQPYLPRAELCHQLPTNSYDGIIYIQLPGGPSDGFRYERNKDICRCRVDKQCQCQQCDFSEDIYLEKSDKYVTEVANSVCHDPFPLFYNLGLENPVIYQENNSRDRDPVLISQKELVINLLHRWIEVRPTGTTLKQLSIALCKADFHIINNKLYDLYKNRAT